MNHDQIDNQLKEYCQRQTMELPSNIRSRIDETLAQLPRHQYTVKLWRNASVAAILIIGILFSCAAISPAAAATLQKIPFIGSVFGLVGDIGLKAANEKGITTQPKETASEQGITIKVTEALYDGTRLAIGYIQESDKMAQNWQVPEDIEFYINGEKSTLNWSHTGNSLGEGQYAAVLDIKSPQPFPDKFNLEVKFKQFGNVSGNWIICLPVSKNETKPINKLFTPMLSKTFNDTSITVKSLAFNISAAKLDIELSQPIDTGKFFSFDVFNDKDKKLQTLSVSGELVDTKENRATMQIKVLLAPMDNIPEYIVIKPFSSGESLDLSSYSTIQDQNENTEKQEEAKYIKELELKIPLAGIENVLQH